MSRLFHDEEDGSPEPVPGLPDDLPEGERIIWQGRPDAVALGLHVFHIRFIIGYFLIATGWRAAELSARGASADVPGAVALSAAAAILAIGGLMILAWLMARSTIYTITTKRVVLRYGVAIRKYVNAPFAQIAGVAMKSHGKRKGDIALSISDGSRVGYLHMWPHARPFRFGRSEPMLRAIPDAPDVAGVLCEAIRANAPSAVSLTPPDESAAKGARVEGDVAPRPADAVAAM